MNTDFIIILVTCGSRKEAVTIVGALLKKRLAACANIVSGINSKFWWKGKIGSAKEFLILIKTKRKNFKAIEHEIKRTHSYDVPEIIGVPIIEGSRDYLKWVSSSVKRCRDS